MRAATALTALGAVALAACAPAPLTAGTASATAAATDPATTTSALAPSTTASPSPTVDSCATLAADLSLEEQVGQLFIIGLDSAELDETTRRAIADYDIGSVILLSNRTSGSSAIRTLTASISKEGTARLPIMIAVDQEGGTVQRLQGDGFSTIPTAREQGTWSVDDLRAQATSWAQQLKKAGVDYNLAPVADVVPESKRDTNAPIGSLKRDFGADAEQVSESVTAFIDGMRAGGIMTSAKHFPGLGEVTENTDYAVAHDDDIDEDSVALEPFEAAIDAGVSSVMISSAIFEKIDPDNEGVFSSAVITDLLRGKLGYDGVVIADDLGAAKAVGDVAPGERAVRFLAAGGDLVINADPRLMGDMVAAVLDEADDDADFRAGLETSTARILTLKAEAGLLSCG
ncbi:glycoside hydrolase family 3 N-terminal domain-containing protein [Tessaracoccus palaemonis]|uniref:Glycoside hydrolase family 3 n=1 Tax=Tessaracoccus palaemonis TaxID=2829499 RepID=A0ABX8SK65_9ACTN|nr:glycoside hydrolase family 3 N-terminal domain-containing protein [Tessaracoccus palaemonis]QXT62383.1 glycoside hydrolase family 3 [Tessaracoccus palaemonis]